MAVAFFFFFSFLFLSTCLVYLACFDMVCMACMAYGVLSIE